MKNTLSVLVVGCGRMGASHAHAYHAIEGFNLVGQISGGNITIFAIGSDLKGIPAENGQVVGQAGVGDGVILRQDGVFSGKAVKLRHLPVVINKVELMVLEKDENDVLKIGYERADRW